MTARCFLQCAVLDRTVVLVEAGSANESLYFVEGDVKPRLNQLEQRQDLCHDLGSDVIALQDHDLERLVGAVAVSGCHLEYAK